jgi:hypothetical protein
VGYDIIDRDESGKEIPQRALSAPSGPA